MQQQARRLTAEQAFELARQSQADGQLDDAKRLYESLLRFQPNHAGALTLLGSIHYQRGDDIQGDAFVDRAVQIYREAVAQAPDQTAMRAALVNQLLARDRADEALRYLDALELQMNPVRSDAKTFASTRAQAVERGRPPIVINTVPKSASETIWNRLAAGLGMAQSHLSIGLFPDCCIVPYRMRTFMDGGVIAKEHIPATRHNVRQLTEAGIDRMVFHVRDPRQATLSWAHFVQDDVSMRLMAPIWRKVVPPAAVLAKGVEATIDWSIDDRTRAVIRRANRIQRRILDELGATVDWTVGPASTGPAFHHMGTHRMGADPGESVVDADCRTHDLDNCWIASSSVFPTSGAMNPTLTIAALALRVADDVEARLSRRT